VTDLGRFEVMGGDYQVIVYAPARPQNCLTQTVTLPPSFDRYTKIDQNTTVDMLLQIPQLQEEVVALLHQMTELDQETSEAGADAITDEMKYASALEAPLRALRNFYRYSQEDLDALIAHLNRKLAGH
jgi:hypothetical protein